MRLIHQDLDTDYGHRKMTAALKLIGYHINHKKVLRKLIKEEIEFFILVKLRMLLKG